MAASKQSFSRSTLDYLSSQIATKKRAILDVGCGFGYFLEMALRNDWNAFGVKIADTAVLGTRKRVGEKNIFHGSLREAGYADNTFDTLTIWDVLVMVENPFEELRECYRIMKEKGKIGIRVRNVTFQRMVYRLYSLFSNLGLRLNIKKPYVFHRYNFTAVHFTYCYNEQVLSTSR